MSNPKSIDTAADPCVLNRDIPASTRLSLQHYIWKENIGYLLHPSIHLSNPAPSIADVGTGTGIWLLDIFRQLPNAQLHGFDISIDQFPAPGFLPPNVSFHPLNILHDIPPEYIEKYDVVHARLLVQVVNQAGGDPRPVIQNLLKLVKPGGYLQWEEPNDDAGNRPPIKSDPSNVSEYSEKLLKGLDTQFRPYSHSCSSTLADTFEEQGLQNVLREEFWTDSYLLVLDQMNYLGLFQEIISRLEGDLKMKFSGLFDKAAVEARKGVAWKVRRFVFVGQKP